MGIRSITLFLKIVKRASENRCSESDCELRVRETVKEEKGGGGRLVPTGDNGDRIPRHSKQSQHMCYPLVLQKRVCT